MGNNELTSYVIGIVASVFGAVFTARVFGHWSKAQWGHLITCLAGAAVAAFCIFKTHHAISILSFLGEKIASAFPT